MTQLDRVKLLRDTVGNLEEQKNFPFSDAHRQEWETALNEAKEMLEIEKENRRKETNGSANKRGRTV